MLVDLKPVWESILPVLHEISNVRIIESAVVNRTAGYAGTVDCVAKYVKPTSVTELPRFRDSFRVIDWKTSRCTCPSWAHAQSSTHAAPVLRLPFADCCLSRGHSLRPPPLREPVCSLVPRAMLLSISAVCCCAFSRSCAAHSQTQPPAGRSACHCTHRRLSGFVLIHNSLSSCSFFFLSLARSYVVPQPRLKPIHAP
jgi:hypothetical protein